MRNAWSVLCLLCACTAGPVAPPPGAGIVAILPFIDESHGADAEEFGAIFSSEMAKAAGWRILRPVRVRAALEVGESASRLADALRAARRLNADLVIAVAVTECDPYDPPRLGAAVQILRTQAADLTDADVDRITQSANWRAPFPVTRDRAGHAVAAFERIWDARTRSTLAEIADFAADHDTSDAPSEGVRHFTAAHGDFMRFASRSLATEVLSRLGK